MIIFDFQKTFITFHFTVLAIYEKRDTFWKRYHAKIFTMINATVVFFIFLEVCSVTHPDDFMDTLTYFVHFSFVNFLWSVNYLNKGSLLKCRNEKNYEYRFLLIREQQGEFIRKAEKNLKYYPYYTVIFHVGFYIAILNPLIMYLLRGRKIIRKYQFFIPAHYPWNINNDTVYYITSVFQWGLTVFLGSYIPGIPIIILLFIEEVLLQYNILFTAVQILDDNIDDSIFKLRNVITKGKSELKSSNNESNYESLLIEIIHHHEVIVRYIKNFSRPYKWLLLLFLMQSSLLFISGVYLLSNADYTPSKIIQKIYEFITVFPMFILLCYSGETLSSKNNDLRNMLYGVKWYDTPIRFRKLFLFMLSNTTKETNIKFTEVFTASYRLAASVTQSSYSYLNILMSFQK